MTKKKTHNLTNKGFTLVELIVVLVILAILAAILVPTLLGYIDEARIKRYLPNAKACMDAAQAAFVEQYAKNGDIEIDIPVVTGGDASTARGNDDQDITKTEFAQNILKYAGMTGDQEPLFFMVAVGSNAANDHSKKYTVSDYDKYTVYYGVYVEEEGAKPLYFYNGEWFTKNPRPDTSIGGKDIFDDHNIVLSGPLKGKRLQYYLIVNNHQSKNSDETNIAKKPFWDWLKTLEK